MDNLPEQNNHNQLFVVLRWKKQPQYQDWKIVQVQVFFPELLWCNQHLSENHEIIQINYHDTVIKSTIR